MIFVFLFAVLTMPSILAQNIIGLPENSSKVCVYYFYSPTCHVCQSIKPFLENLEQKYSENLTIKRFDVTVPENFERYNSFCSLQNLSIEKRGVPLIVTKDSFLMGSSQITETLEKDIRNIIARNDTACPDVNSCFNNVTANSTNSQQIITLPLIIAAAAADSINPCAIGVLIFLVGFLLLSSGKNYKRTLKIASIYIVTVYIAYFLAGIGVLNVLIGLPFLSVITKVFGISVGILGLINIKDALSNKTHGTLAIPAAAKPLIERWVYKASIPGAIVLGIIVSAVELPCTGGMYLAILTLMAKTVTRSTAIEYLLLYNFIFVMPLILATFIFIKGFEAEKMQEWLEKHKRKSRMIMGLVLLAIGAVLFLL